MTAFVPTSHESHAMEFSHPSPEARSTLVQGKPDTEPPTFRWANRFCFAEGLTTSVETALSKRSDCHAFQKATLSQPGRVYL